MCAAMHFNTKIYYLPNDDTVIIIIIISTLIFVSVAVLIFFPFFLPTLSFHLIYFI